MTEWVLVPREPVDAQLTSMALTYDHGYGLRNAFERENIRLHMAQLHRAMLEAAPAAPQQAEPVAWAVFDPSGEAIYDALFKTRCVEYVDNEYRYGNGAAKHWAVRPVFAHPPADEAQRLRDALEKIKLETFDDSAELIARRALEGK